MNHLSVERLCFSLLGVVWEFKLFYLVCIPMLNCLFFCFIGLSTYHARDTIQELCNKNYNYYFKTITWECRNCMDDLERRRRKTTVPWIKININNNNLVWGEKKILSKPPPSQPSQATNQIVRKIWSSIIRISTKLKKMTRVSMNFFFVQMIGQSFLW